MRFLHKDEARALAAQNAPVEAKFAPTALFCLTLDNPFRRFFVNLVEHQLFERFILLTILVNCVFIAMDNPLDKDPNSQLNLILATAEWIFQGIFTFEMIVKIIAMGFAQHPQSYLRNWWNRLDFTIVVLGYLPLLPGLANSSNISGIRSLRVLRPLRTIKRIPGLKRIVNTLLQSLPLLLDVVIVLFFIFFIFGLIGVQFWNGVMQGRCYAGDTLVEDDTRLCSKTPSQGRQCPAGQTCKDYQNPNFGFTSFDNIGAAFLTIFQCITLEGWSEIMDYIMDATNDLSAIYFVFLVLWGSFFIINLTLAVITIKFREYDEDSPVLLVLEDADEDEETENLHGDDTLLSKVRFQVQRIVQSKPFQYSIFLAIVLNTISLAMESHGMSRELAEALEDVNLVFTILFATEMLLKFVGLGVINYWSDRMNAFDGVIVILSILELIIVASTTNTGSGAPADTGALTVFRTFRLLRVFKLVRSWSSFKKLLGAMYTSIDSLGYFSLLLFLFIFIFALLGMQQFGGLMYEEDGTRSRSNFDTLWWAVVTVFQVLSTENWNDVMYTAMRATDASASVYFVLLIMLGNYVLINVFVAVLLSAFTTQAKAEAARKRAAKLKERMNKTQSVLRNAISNQNKLANIAREMEGIDLSEEETVDQQRRRQSNGVATTQPAPSSLIGMATRRLANDKGNASSKAVNESLRLKVRQASIVYADEDLPSSPLGNLGFSSSLRSAVKGAVGSISGGMGEVNQPSGLMSNRTDSASSMAHRPVSDPEGDEVAEAPSADGPGGGQEEGPGKTPVRNHSMSQEMALASMSTASSSTANNRSRSPLSQAASTPSIFRGASDHSRDMLASHGKSVSFAELAGIGDRVETESVVSSHDDDLEMGQLDKDYSLANHNSESQEETTTSFTERTSSFFGRRKRLHRQESILVQSRNRTMELKGDSLLFLTTDSTLRTWCARIISWKHFDNIILALIFLSSVQLAVEEPGLDPQSDLGQALYYTDLVFVGVFTLEMLLKVIVFGFVDGKETYLHDPWNVLDFIIVLSSLINVFVEGAELDTVRILRLLRTLRPLRIISRAPEMRVVVNCIIRSVPAIVNLLFLCALFWLIFGILGVQLWKGQLYRCNDPSVRNRSQCIGEFVEPESRRSIDRVWSNEQFNFDNILNAMLMMFIASTLEGWPSMMTNTVDVAGVDQQPIVDNHPENALYFIAFVLIASFFMVNLFVGVVTDNFNKLKEEFDGFSVLNSAQRSWVKAQQRLLHTKPRRKIERPKNPVRRAVFAVVTHERFEILIGGLICLNVLIMSVRSYNQPEWVTQFLDLSNLVFTVIFALEVAAKNYAVRPARYFADKWNVFDFVIAVGSIVGLLVEAGVAASLLRVFRIGRIFRLIKRAKGLRTMFNTLLYSLGSLGNVGSLLFLLFFIYAVLGMNLFGFVRLQDNLNERANFRTFISSLLTLFRMSTGENWHLIMLDAMVEPPMCIPGVDCGTPWALLYFLSFIVLVSFIMLNLFIAVILENFTEVMSKEDSMVTEEHFSHFMEVWSRFDPRATQYIHVTKFERFVLELGVPLGLDEDASAPEIVALMQYLDIPVSMSGYMSFKHCLHALTEHRMGTELPDGDVRASIEAQLLKAFPMQGTDPAEQSERSERKRSGLGAFVRRGRKVQDSSRSNLNHSSSGYSLAGNAEAKADAAAQAVAMESFFSIADLYATDEENREEFFETARGIYEEDERKKTASNTSQQESSAEDGNEDSTAGTGVGSSSGTTAVGMRKKLGWKMVRHAAMMAQARKLKPPSVEDVLRVFTNVWTQFDIGSSQLLHVSQLPAFLVELDPPLGVTVSATADDVDRRMRAMRGVPVSLHGYMSFGHVLLSLARRAYRPENELYWLKLGETRPPKTLLTFRPLSEMDDVFAHVSQFDLQQLMDVESELRDEFLELVVTDFEQDEEDEEQGMANWAAQGEQTRRVYVSQVDRLRKDDAAPHLMDVVVRIVRSLETGGAQGTAMSISVPLPQLSAVMEETGEDVEEQDRA